MLRVHCKAEKKAGEDEEYTRDILASVRGGFKQLKDRFSGVGTSNQAEWQQAYVPNGENSEGPATTSPLDRDEVSSAVATTTQSTVSAAAAGQKEEAFALMAVVLGLLSFVCLVLLAIKSWFDAQKERKKSRVADKIAEAAKASFPDVPAKDVSSEAGSVASGSLSSATASTASASSVSKYLTPPTLRPAMNRLISLGAGPFVYEKK